MLSPLKRRDCQGNRTRYAEEPPRAGARKHDPPSRRAPRRGDGGESARAGGARGGRQPAEARAEAKPATRRALDASQGGAELSKAAAHGRPRRGGAENAAAARGGRGVPRKPSRRSDRPTRAERRAGGATPSDGQAPPRRPSDQRERGRARRAGARRGRAARTSADRAEPRGAKPGAPAGAEWGYRACLP